LPFYTNYGFNPWMGFEPWREVKVQAVDKFVDELKKIQEEVEAALCKACDDMKHFADQKCTHMPDYKVGEAIHYHTRCFTRCHGSKITTIIQNWCAHQCIFVTSLQATYHPRTTNNAAVTSGSWGGEYVVEEILDSHLRHNKLESLVKWEGYTSETICGNQRMIVGMHTMPLPLSTVNILRHQDKLCRCNLMISNSDLIKISQFQMLLLLLVWKLKCKRGVMLEKH